MACSKRACCRHSPSDIPVSFRKIRSRVRRLAPARRAIVSTGEVSEGSSTGLELWAALRNYQGITFYFLWLHVNLQLESVCEKVAQHCKQLVLRYGADILRLGFNVKIV